MKVRIGFVNCLLLAGVFGLPLMGCELFLSGVINVPDDNDDTDDGDDDDGDAGNLAVFVDPDTGFSTSDVLDVDGEIVRFDTQTKAIIWAEDGSAYQEGSWDVDGVFLAGGAFQVRFGTEDGQPGAYFTETGPATICQIEANGVNIFISATNTSVPQN